MCPKTKLRTHETCKLTSQSPQPYLHHSQKSSKTAFVSLETNSKCLLISQQKNPYADLLKKRKFVFSNNYPPPHHVAVTYWQLGKRVYLWDMRTALSSIFTTVCC